MGINRFKTFKPFELFKSSDRNAATMARQPWI